MCAAARWGMPFLLLFALPLAAARPDEPDDKPAPPITLPVEKKTGTQLAAAADYIAAEDWKQAVQLLQHVLDRKEDVLFEHKAGGVVVLLSARAEARRLLAGLPPAGKAFYEKTFGPTAADLLGQGRKLRDREKLAAVVRSYLHTAAGPEALEELAREEVRAGDWAAAGRHYEELLGQRGVARWTTEDLYQAALAARRGSGARPDASVVRELLARAGAEGIRVGNRTLTREQLREELEKAPPAAPAGEWPIYRGDAARTNQGTGGPAFLEARWRQPMTYDDVKEGPLAAVLQKAESQLKRNSKPVLPAYFPVTATITRGEQRLPLLIFKNHWGLNAVNTKTGKTEWNSPANWGLERMLDKKADPRKVQALYQWLNTYVDQNLRPEIVFENSVTGTLSTDGQFLYVVEDFAVPPPKAVLAFAPGTRPPRDGMAGPADLQEAIRHSRIQAFELATNGKIKWEVGGSGEKDNPLSDCFFLGPPLPLRGLLYLLTQKEKELRLVCLDPQAGGKVVSVLPLAHVGRTLAEDNVRRTQAVHLAYADGILVVPTNTGAVFGVNLQANTLAWAFPYREKEEAPAVPNVGFRRGLPPGWMMGPDGRLIPNIPQTHWKVTAPAIHDGKVVFAAPDADGLFCINLRDGSLVWKTPRREEDLYFAGITGGKVLVVGKKTVRALGLAKGETLWTLDTGLPSGQGIAGGGIYYLPLSEASRSHEPEICAIDTARGVIAAHLRSRTKEVPGNLIFFEEDVVSQTASEVTAYPQLKFKIAQMDELLKKNPNDPDGLTARAELRLDQGDLRGAIEDLRKALANKPAADMRARARARLYEALTDYIQRDFNAAEEYLKEYEGLCKVDVEPGASDSERQAAEKEGRRRRGQFLFLTAKGREQQGKLLEALQGYLDLAAQGSDDLVPAFDDLAVKVRLDVWARNRVDELLRKATPAQRKQLEEEIERRRKKAEDARGEGELRAFVAAFGPESAGGRAARLALAERLIESGPKADREAELLLEAVRLRREDLAHAARATVMLARLNARRGQLEDAVYYYRLLVRDYPKVALPDGKTGQEIWDTLATDKRFLPYLETRALPVGKLKVTTEPGQPMTNQVYVFEHAGEPLPYFQQHTLGLVFGTHQLQMIDTRNSETLVWGLPLTHTMFQNIVQGHGQPNAARFSYRTQGHLVVLPVGHLVFGIDPVNRKILWERSLAGSLTTGQPNGAGWQQLTVDPRDGSILILYPDGWAQRLGRRLVLGPSALCLMTRDGLEGIDPLTGKTLWQRGDVRPGALFGDEEVVCVVEQGIEGKAQATRVLRLADGTALKAPDFGALYDHRLHTIGRHLLLSEGKDAPTLRLYDTVAGKDVWTKTFPARSTVMQSEDPNLAGVVEPNGKVWVFDLVSRKEIVSTDKGQDITNPKTGMDPEHLDKLQGITLLADDRQIYLATNGPTDPNLARFGGVQPNLMPGLGMRSVPINGRLYVYDRQTGNFRWRMPVSNQMIVLDHFQEMPILLLTSRYTKWQNVAGRPNVTQIASVMSMDKRTGKVLYLNDTLSNVPNFHALKVDVRAGRIELTSTNVTIVHGPVGP